MDLRLNIFQINKFLDTFVSNSIDDVNFSESIKNKVNQVATLGHQNDFRDIEANGFRTGIYALATLLDFTVTIKKRSEWIDILNFANWYLDWLLSFADDTKRLEPLNERQYKEMMSSFLDLRWKLFSVHTKFPTELFRGNSKYVHSVTRLLFYKEEISGFWSFLKFALSTNYRKKILMSVVEKFDVDYVQKMYNFCDHKWLLNLDNFANKLSYRDVKAKEIFPKVSSKWKLELDGSNIVLKLNGSPKERTVRCRVYQNEAGLYTKKRKLIFHAHGGGFLAMSPESHEMYLFEYSRQLPDAVVVSVDYSLAPGAPFPVALQELLDVYLWLTSGTFEHLVDGGPVTSVLTGDSTGGALSLSLLALLRDIDILWPFDVIPMPRSAVLVCPMLSVEPSFYPSHLLQTLLYSTGLWADMVAISAYSPINFTMGLKAWSVDTVDQDPGLERLVRLHRHPYISPINCDVDKLVDIRLSLISSNTCELLDQSIVMANNWAGPVTLDVVDRLPHGFMQLASVCDKAKEAVNLVIERLNEW